MPSERYRELAGGPRSDLVRIYRAGEPPAIQSLRGFEFCGYNHPWLMSVLGIRKFIKAFFVAEGSEFGCNTPVEQNGLDGDWIAKPSEQAPRRFGFFRIERVEAAPGQGGEAVLLDYGRGRNRWFELSRLLRDYLVRVDPGSDELLLGKASAALGPLRIPLGFFLLERHRPIAVEPKLRSG